MGSISDSRALLGASRPGSRVGFLFLMGLAFSSGPACGQTVTAVTASQTAGAMCRVFTVISADGQVQDLHASCNGRGLMLGLTTGYQVVTNGALNATLIDTHRDAERRVLLITIQGDGTPLVEDLSGDLAVAAGRGPMSPLSGLDVDLGQFATDGIVAVRPALNDTIADKSSQVSVGQQIAAENVRRQAATAQN